MNRDETIKRIRAALKRRSGKPWSVTGGRGTAWGWITIDAPPARRTWGYRLRSGEWIDTPKNYEPYDTGEPGRRASPADCAELAQLLGLERVPRDSVSVPAAYDYYQEYIDRAEGRTPTVIGKQYWD